MEVPIQLVAAAFSAILFVQGWQVQMLYRLAARIQRVETVIQAAGHKLPEMVVL